MPTFHFNEILLMVREDNAFLDTKSAMEIALRIFSRLGKPSACVHRMPEGLSAFFQGHCVRCGEEK